MLNVSTLYKGCFVLLLILQSRYAIGNQFFTEIKSYSHSAIAPIKQVVDSLEGPQIERGEVAFSNSHIELGYVIPVRPSGGSVSVSLFSRLDYYLHFTPDTAEVIYATENNVPLSDDKNYIVDLKANNIAANGLRVGYLGQYSKKFEYAFYFSYLRAHDIVLGQLTGSLGGQEGSINGNLALDYQYSDDVFFKRSHSGVKASGFTNDFGLTWKPTSKVSIAFFAKDIFSRVYWKQQHRTVAQASSDRIGLDENGDLQTNPVLSWTETQRSITQVLPRQMTLQERYNVSERTALRLEHFLYDDFLFNRIAYEYRVKPNVLFDASYDFTARAVTVGLSSSSIKFSLTSNSLRWSKTKTFGLAFGLKFPI